MTAPAFAPMHHVCLLCQIGQHELCTNNSADKQSAGGFDLPACSCSHRRAKGPR